MYCVTNSSKYLYLLILILVERWICGTRVSMFSRTPLWPIQDYPPPTADCIKWMLDLLKKRKTITWNHRVSLLFIAEPDFQSIVVTRTLRL
ncbi:unnamed protein product [Moneuplotes crassus]|uniref:Uncharacterized protein n=1 Tax=Euplotes crassus TaxID=5936 RepID=A0AAD2D5W9_EUPCR|nr:unnamed protein product [Moneuplotes crassus]